MLGAQPRDCDVVRTLRSLPLLQARTICQGHTRRAALARLLCRSAQPLLPCMHKNAALHAQQHASARPMQRCRPLMTRHTFGDLGEFEQQLRLLGSHVLPGTKYNPTQATLHYLQAQQKTAKVGASSSCGASACVEANGATHRTLPGGRARRGARVRTSIQPLKRWVRHGGTLCGAGRGSKARHDCRKRPHAPRGHVGGYRH